MIASILCSLTRMISGLSVRWQGCIPEDTQRVYFANHTSHLDFMALWAALPKHLRIKTRPVAARDYWSKTKLKSYIANQVIHAVLIDRKNISLHDKEQNPINKMLEALDNNFSLIIFPEGARNTLEEIRPFKSGLYHLIKKRPDIEYIPVYLDNLSRILPRGEFIMIPLLGSATFGSPLKIDKNETKNDFLIRAKKAVEELKCQ